MTEPDTHDESERYGWTIVVPDHPPRSDSPAYRASRALMVKIVETVQGWPFGAGPYQDHHGGAVWVHDDTGWLCLGLPLGIEWSAQFCADPAKIDALRLLTRRILAAFPETIAQYEKLGYTAGQQLLDTPITTADQVALWTDSIFNASMPLPAGAHTGVLPTAAGYHHYPKPIVDIDHFRRDDFVLFVADDKGLPAVVVPVSADPSDHRVRLLAANAASSYATLLMGEGILPPRGELHEDASEPSSAGARDQDGTEDTTVLPADDPLARQAFHREGPATP